MCKIFNCFILKYFIWWNVREWNETTGQIQVSYVIHVKPHLIVLKTQMHMSVIHELNVCSAEYVARSSYILLFMKYENKGLIFLKT